MEHKMIQEIITRMLTGIATPEETHELTKWVESSEENKSAFSAMKNASVLAGLARNTMNTEYLNSRYGEFIQLRSNSDENLKPVYRLPGKKFMVSIRQIAAAVIFIVGVSIFLGYMIFHVPVNGTSLHQLVVPSGQQAELILSDGTKIWLNSRSKLSYPGNFTGNIREVILDGEAFFEVSHNPDKPFIVRTDYLGIKVLGTSFNFSAYKDDKDLKMTLIEGSISIIKDQNTEIAKLIPDQTGVFSKSEKTLSLSSGETELYTSWRNGQFKFRKLSFEDISRRLSRNFNVDFIIQNENMKYTTFNGSFYNYESLDQILRILQRNYPFRYEITGKEVIIN